MDYLKRAQEIAGELSESRRYIHQCAELGQELPKTVAFIKEKLLEMGYDPIEMGGGVVATVGHGGKTFLLRGDMDALPMAEESGEPFASTNGNCHSCGHDMHATFLLGAARLLKENEAQLKGTVKLMFQPGEETGTGAKAMIEAGVLENPTVDAAFAIHTAPGPIPQGFHLYNLDGGLMTSIDQFEIKVHGKGGHGASPDLAIDPINIGAHIVLALQELIAREVAPGAQKVMTVCSINAGVNYNVIPDDCVLKGTIRTMDADVRATLVKRLEEVAKGTAATFRGTADVVFPLGLPALICDKALCREMAQYIKEIDFPGLQGISNFTASASEDFAYVAEKVPTFYMMLSAGPGDPAYSSHNPKVRFNEETLPLGAAIMAHCATRWLDEQN